MKPALLLAFALLLTGCSTTYASSASPTQYYVMAHRGSEYVKLQSEGKTIVAHCTSITLRNHSRNDVGCTLPPVGATVNMERWGQELTWQLNSDTTQNFFIDSEQ
jgi:hypothetical protein